MTVVERGLMNGGLRRGAGMDVKKMTFLIILTGQPAANRPARC